MIEVENYVFFAIFSPLILIALVVLHHYRDEDYRYYRFFLICMVLLVGHILLPFFDVGIFPELRNDPLFYSILFLLGMGFTILYIVQIENISFRQIGWKSENVIRDVAIGILTAVVLLLISALLEFPFLRLKLPNLSVLKFITVVFFALGGIYEESLFRGLLQTAYLKKDDFNSYQRILMQALAFLFINLFYFPFDILGLITYLIMFLLAIVTGWLAQRYSLISSSTAHVLFVLLAGLLS
ncbi:MAG: CPBP family glutamic-type intramembrane protease [Promethearchaeia archaeon]